MTAQNSASPSRVARLRVALVGPGRIARAHLTAIRNNEARAELVAIVGLPSEHERLDALATEFGAGRSSTDLDAVLADPGVDAVVLTVPNHLHKEIGLRCLAAGKHVLMEKPLANTLEEAEALVQAADRAGRILMTAQCRRFFPGAQAAKERVARLGRPLDIVQMLGVHVDAPKADWWRSAGKTGGLALGLNGPHVVDTMLWLMGEAPVQVFAQTTRLKPDQWEGEDQATLVLSFADGSIATGHLSLNMKPEVNERWLTGPKGTMQLSNDRSLKIDGVEVVEARLSPYLDGDESFDAQFREFADAIGEGRPPLASGREVLPVIAVLEAALASARRNQPVQL